MWTHVVKCFLQPLFLCIFTFSVFQTYDQQIFYDQYRPANPHIY